MDNVETQMYDADATAAALIDCTEIQDSDDETLGEHAASRKPLPPLAANSPVPGDASPSHLAAEPPCEAAEAAHPHEAPEPLREVAPPPPVQEEDQLEFAPEAKAEVKKILGEVRVSVHGCTAL